MTFVLVFVALAVKVTSDDAWGASVVVGICGAVGAVIAQLLIRGAGRDSKRSQ